MIQSWAPAQHAADYSQPFGRARRCPLFSELSRPFQSINVTSQPTSGSLRKVLALPFPRLTRDP